MALVSLPLGIAPEPELLILDDQTLGLDTVVRRDFLESLIHIIQKNKRTIFQNCPANDSAGRLNMLFVNGIR